MVNLKRMICRLFGHQWTEVGRNPVKHELFGRLEPKAGLDMDCRSCGAEWRDAADPLNLFRREHLRDMDLNT